MFIKIKNCKICSKKGKTIFKIKFNHKDIIKFFNSEYDKKTSRFLKKKIGNKYFILKKCIDCDFIWQENTPKENFLKKIYDNIIDPTDSLRKSKKINSSQIKFFQNEIFYFQNLLKKKNLNVLDFGAGWGNWLISIQKYCSNVYATELSLVRKKYLINNNIKVINLNKKKNYINYFDIVRLEQVLEHVTNLNKIVLTIKKIMKKGSILSIGVPNGKYVIKNERIIIKKGPIQPLEHLNCFNNKSLKILFDRHGFKAINVFEIFKILIKSKKFDYDYIRFILIMAKNSLLSTKINFIKI